MLEAPDADADGTVAGRVLRDPGDEPVAYRTVVAVRTRDGDVKETRTTDSGGYSFRLEPGRYELALRFDLGDTTVQAPSAVTLGPSEIIDDADFIVRSQLARPVEPE